jgi:hypothetical protein
MVPTSDQALPVAYHFLTISLASVTSGNQRPLVRPCPSAGAVAARRRAIGGLCSAPLDDHTMPGSWLTAPIWPCDSSILPLGASTESLAALRCRGSQSRKHLRMHDLRVGFPAATGRAEPPIRCYRSGGSQAVRAPDRAVHDHGRERRGTQTSAQTPKTKDRQEAGGPNPGATRSPRAGISRVGQEARHLGSQERRTDRPDFNLQRPADRRDGGLIRSGKGVERTCPDLRPGSMFRRCGRCVRSLLREWAGDGWPTAQAS